jgi:alcohol dehydrogenase class IV
VAQLLIGNADVTALDGVRWVRKLCSDLKVAPLSSHGVRREHFAELSRKASMAGSMKGNPITLAPEELREILARACAGPEKAP